MSNLKVSLSEINDFYINPIITNIKSGLDADKRKNIIDSDKFYYNKKKMKKHFDKLITNLDSCRNKCMYEKHNVSKLKKYNSCKKGCHIEFPMEKNVLFHGSNIDKNINTCNGEGIDADECQKGKVTFKNIWGKEDYNVSNKALGDCKTGGLYEDISCEIPVSLQKRYDGLKSSFEEHNKIDRNNQVDLDKWVLKLRGENNKKIILNNKYMDNLVKTHREGFGSKVMQGRIEDNLLKAQSQLYKNIAISILGICLLIITIKKVKE